jgi:hypothetical protein
MRYSFSNDASKMRIMAARMRDHAMATTSPDYIRKFECAAAELERKAEAVERRTGARPLDS